MTYAAEDARVAEEVGFDGAWSTENSGDPFLPLALAAEHTKGLVLGPSVAIAFARTPMNVAYQAVELHRYSSGRFILGLGSQVKPHIEKRFSMPWSRPAARLREFVLALRAIWTAWETGEALSFRGEFTTHTLMTPAFTPPKHDFGQPPIYLAAVGPLMTEVAGEVADGLLAHPFLTERYLRDVMLPAIEAGRVKGGRQDRPFEIGLSAFVALDDAERSRVLVLESAPLHGYSPGEKSVGDQALTARILA